MQIFANLEQHFYSSMEFYVIHLKNQRGENLIIVRTSSKQLDPEILVTGTVLFSSLLCKYNQWEHWEHLSYLSWVIMVLFLISVSNQFAMSIHNHAR